MPDPAAPASISDYDPKALQDAGVMPDPAVTPAVTPQPPQSPLEAAFGPHIAGALNRLGSVAKALTPNFGMDEGQQAADQARAGNYGQAAVSLGAGVLGAGLDAMGMGPERKLLKGIPTATVEVGTTQTPVGRQAYDIYKDALSKGDTGTQADYLKGLTDAMHSSQHTAGWDRLYSAITGKDAKLSDIMSPPTANPLDVGGSFEGMVSPNLRIPLHGLNDDQIAAFNAVAGNALKQDAMAASRIRKVEPGAEPAEGWTRGHSVFVPTEDHLPPDAIRGFAQALPEGHSISHARYPEGYQFDINPRFGDNGPEGISAEDAAKAYAASLGKTIPDGHIIPHDYQSVYTEASDYGKTRQGLVKGIQDDYLKDAQAAGFEPAQAKRFLGGSQDDLPEGLGEAYGRYNRRIGDLAASEKALSQVSQKVGKAHASFIERVLGKPVAHATGGKVMSNRALEVAHHYATGGGADPAQWERAEERGMLHSGGILSSIPGRTDKLNMSVVGGSYVMPADVVSSLGEGNTLAGTRVLDKMFAIGPYGAAMPHIAGGGMGIPHATPPRIGKASGGASHQGGSVPIVAAGGEYVVHPDAIVAKFGSLDHGHQVLDKFVTHVRHKTIKTLKKLPGPKT